MYGNDGLRFRLLFALEQLTGYQYPHTTNMSEKEREIPDKSTQESTLNLWTPLGHISGNRGNYDGHVPLRSRPYIAPPAGRVFTNLRLLQVKQMLAYCTKGASNYIGNISTRPKLRNNSPLGVESKSTHSILRYSNPPAYEPTTLVQIARIIMIHTAITASTVIAKSHHKVGGSVVPKLHDRR